MFSRIVLCALFSGTSVGLVIGLLQWFFVQPVLLQAELYETGQLTHFGAEALSSATMPERQIDWVRDGLSLAFTMIIYVGYALVMIALIALFHSDQKLSRSQGLLWGLAGYAAVQLAPSFGLPPETPGVAAAEIVDRQIWWGLCVIATAVSLGILAFNRSTWLKIVACLLILVPHIIGAPHPVSFAGAVPPEVSALFASRVTVVGLVAWLLLGLAVAYFWNADNAD